MASAASTQYVREFAATFTGLRAPTADEVRLIAEARDAGATLRRDDAYADFLNGVGGLPVDWGTYVHLEDYGVPYIEAAAAKASMRQAAFIIRCTSGDLRPLIDRIDAARVAAGRKVAA